MLYKIVQVTEQFVGPFLEIFASVPTKKAYVNIMKKIQKLLNYRF